MKKTTLQVFNDNAEKYEQKFMGLGLYDETYDAFLDTIGDASSVLEIGCGPGNVTRYLLAHNPSLQILATDFAPEMVAIARRNNPTASCRVLDCREILSLGQTLDAIACGFCAPYLDRKELSKLLFDSHEILNRNGKIYLSCIEGQYESSGWQSSSDGKASAFVHFYAEPDLRELFSNAGFEVARTFRIDYENLVHLVVIASKIDF